MLHDLTYMWNLEEPNSWKQTVGWCTQELGEGGMKAVCQMVETSSYKKDTFWEYSIPQGDYINETVLYTDT